MHLFWETNTRRSDAALIVKQHPLQTHPAALPDPVAQPPVTEGNAARGGEEEEDGDDEDEWTPSCFDVGAVHGPGDGTGALLLRFNQFLG